MVPKCQAKISIFLFDVSVLFVLKQALFISEIAATVGLAPLNLA